VELRGLRAVFFDVLNKYLSNLARQGLLAVPGGEGLVRLGCNQDALTICTVGTCTTTAHRPVAM
jgi:hypothetical protein